MPSNHLIFCHPLLPLSIFPIIRVFSSASVLHIRWPKYWSFSFTINEYSGLISFRMDWLDLLAVQRTLKSLLQHHSSKASILQHLTFFVVQLSHPYVTTRKTVALTIQICVGKEMSLLFIIPSRFATVSPTKALVSSLWDSRVPTLPGMTCHLTPSMQRDGARHSHPVMGGSEAAGILVRQKEELPTYQFPIFLFFSEIFDIS